MRLKAEEEYKRQMAQEAINRAWNSKAQKRTIWMCGTLVYYKRYEPPSTSLASHRDVDVTRRQIARWYGPARAAATETAPDGNTARPGHTVWTPAAGRPKRAAPEQLRTAPETERTLAEAGGLPPTFDWTVQSLLKDVERGHYDTHDDHSQADLPPSLPVRSRSTGPPVSRRAVRSRTPAGRQKPSRPKQESRQGLKRPQSSDVRPLGSEAKKTGQNKAQPTAEEAQPAHGSAASTLGFFG